MKLSKLKVSLVLANKNMTRNELSRRYGCGVNRISAMLNSQSVRVETAIKLAKALDVDVTEIIETE